MKKLLIFTFFCFIFFSCSNEKKAYEKFLEEESISFENGFKLIEEDLERRKQNLYYLLKDNAKAKYWPLKDWVGKCSNDFSKVYNWIIENEKLVDEDSFDWSEKIIQIDTLLEKLKLEQLRVITDFFNEHGKTFGLRESDIEKRIEENKIRLEAVVKVKNLFLENKGRLDLAKFILKKAKFDLKILEKTLLQNLAEMIGGRVLGGDFGIRPIKTQNEKINIVLYKNEKEYFYLKAKTTEEETENLISKISKKLN